jgi:hypothetical protein
VEKCVVHDFALLTMIHNLTVSDFSDIWMDHIFHISLLDNHAPIAIKNIRTSDCSVAELDTVLGDPGLSCCSLLVFHIQICLVYYDCVL